jgi:hypothetical protein
LLIIAAIPVGAQSIPGAVLAKREPHHHLAYEDSTLRVLRVRVPAHDTTLLHEHAPDYFWIALGASEVVNAQLGAPDAMIKSADLSVHYTVGNFAHVARNPGNTPFDNITVELLAKQTNVHNLCEPAVANQPLDCPRRLPEGTPQFFGVSEHPVFASDQLRVSLVTIPPGGQMLPNSEAMGAWVIALDTAGVGRGFVITGPGRWAGGAFRPAAGANWRALNRGRSVVRLLTVVPLSAR